MVFILSNWDFSCNTTHVQQFKFASKVHTRKKYILKGKKYILHISALIFQDPWQLLIKDTNNWYSEQIYICSKNKTLKLLEQILEQVWKHSVKCMNSD